jgi:histidyl-tRNA synthetase
VAILGPEELGSNQVTIKDMQNGTQELLAIDEAVARVKVLAAAQARPTA